MNYAILFKLNSFILGALSMAFAASLGIAVFMDHGRSTDLSVPAFAVSLVISGSLAIGFWMLGRTGDNTLYHKEALATIGTGWIIASTAGALPYFLIIPELSFAGAFFESASGLTTTGASVLGNLEQQPRSLLFWRAISQWMGGLGVVVFFVSILSFLGAGAKVLFSRESSAEAADLKASRVQDGVKRILSLYLVLSLLCALAFRFCGLSWYDAVLHMFTTLSTGGFSTRSESIAAFRNPALEWTIIAFMAIGGTSFLVIIEILRRNTNVLRTSTEFKAYYLLLGLATLVTAVFLYLQNPAGARLPDSIRTAAFQVVSIMTTTGFATADFDRWMPATHILLLLLMVIGGCSGSTAGGAKVIRFIVALRISLRHIEHAYRRRVIRPLKVNGKALSPNDQESIAFYLVLLGLTIFGSTLLIALLEPGMSLEGTVSTMAACLFNIGPGLAEIGPTRNFAPFSDATKLFLSLLMIMGRLELLAFLALFSPALWKQF